jgi:hypothetical protein
MEADSFLSSVYRVSCLVIGAGCTDDVNMVAGGVREGGGFRGAPRRVTQQLCSASNNGQALALLTQLFCVLLQSLKHTLR